MAVSSGKGERRCTGREGIEKYVEIIGVDFKIIFFHIIFGQVRNNYQSFSNSFTNSSGVSSISLNISRINGRARSLAG